MTTDKIQYVSVTLALSETDVEIMKPGQRVRATLSLESKEAIVVPRHCVFELDGEQVVYVQSELGYEARNVKLGAGTPGRVVIVEGLEEGDVVAIRDPFQSSKGDDKGEEEAVEEGPST